MKNSQFMYLQKRSNGVFYFRRRIPAHLAGLVDARFFHCSLKTRNGAEIANLYAIALKRSEAEIHNATRTLQEKNEGRGANPSLSFAGWRRLRKERLTRRRLKKWSHYTAADVNEILRRWYLEAKKRAEDVYGRAFAVYGSNERLELRKELDEEWQYLNDANPGSREWVVGMTLAQVLEQEDIEVSADWMNEPNFVRFYRQLTTGLLHLNRMAVSLLETGQSPSDPGFASEIAIGAEPPAPANSISVDELIRRFEAEPKRQHLREATKKEYHLIYRALREQIGADTAIHTITRDHIRAIADTFLHLPSRATLTSSDPLHKIAAEAKKKGLPRAHVKTYNKKVHEVSAIFGYATIEGQLTSNPEAMLPYRLLRKRL